MAPAVQIRTMAAAAGGVVAMVLAALTIGPRFSRIFREDGPVEWLTALTYAIAAAVLLRVIRRGAASPLVVIALAYAVVAALDEISFGARLFGWTPPQVLGTTFDGVHDLLVIGPKLVLWLGWPGRIAVVLAVAAVLALTVLLALRHGVPARLRMEVAAVDLGGAPLLGAAVMLTGLAMALDLPFPFLPADALKRSGLEESLELAGGVLTLAYALTRPAAGLRPLGAASLRPMPGE